MLKKIMLPVVLFFMLLSTCVVVKAMEVEDGSVYLYEDVCEKISEMGLPEYINYDSEKYYILCRIANQSEVYMLVEFVPNDLNNIYAYKGNYDWIYFNDASSCTLYVTVNNSGVFCEWTVPSYTHVEVYGHSSQYVYYSDVDIYYEDKTTLFFQETPHPIPLVLGMEEAVLAEMIQPEAVLKEVIAILPMILACLVGYLALRKALAALQAILYQA